MATNVGASDFLDSFSEYTKQIRRNLGLSVTNTSVMSDSSMHQIEREAVITLMPILKASTDEYYVVTTFRQNTYAMDSLFLGATSVQWSKNDSIKTLLYVPMEQWYQLGVSTNLSTKAGYDRRPSYYAYDDNYLYLYPTPVQTADSFFIQAWRRVPSIAALDSLHVIEQKYRPVICNYATWKVAAANNHPLMGVYWELVKPYLQATNAK